MRTISPKQIALVHIAKSRLGIEEEEYRQMLHEFGVKSSKELSTKKYWALMKYFNRLGFKPERKVSPDGRRVDFHPRPSDNLEPPRGFMNEAQAQRIWTIWNQISWAPAEGREAALNNFCKKKANNDCWKWLSYAQAQKVLVILEAMRRQKGKGKRQKETDGQG
jgi:hypothetical protein